MRSPDQIPSGEEEGWGPVVAHNLHMMRTAMQEVLIRESIGGNAGTAKIGDRTYRCLAANGYADPETGRIVAFGNVQNLDPSVIRGKAPFTFRIALIPPQENAGGFSLRIVEYMPRQTIIDKRSLPPAVDAVLGASMQRYNASL